MAEKYKKQKYGIEKAPTGTFAECAKRVLNGPDGSSPFCLLCPLGPQNAGLHQKYAVKYKKQMPPCSFKNREYFKLKIYLLPEISSEKSV